MDCMADKYTTRLRQSYLIALSQTTKCVCILCQIQASYTFTVIIKQRVTHSTKSISKCVIRWVDFPGVLQVFLSYDDRMKAMLTD